MGRENYKVVTAEEMMRLEKLAIQSGCNEELFINEAGSKIAVAALRWIEKRRLSKKVTLLVGKGNNGADAFSAGIHLIDQGVRVRALLLDDEGSRENQKFKKRFVSKKGQVELFSGAADFIFDDLILDGFLGIGFKGDVRGEMAKAISQANGSGRPIISIDIPSGLNATTGAVSSVFICADETVTLGLPKTGLFLREGWNVTGNLTVANFGLPETFFEQAKSSFRLLNEELLRPPRLVRNRHKYQTGYVVGLSGSSSFGGAPKIAGLAALRAGAGIVRVFHLDEIGPCPMELICEKWDAEKWKVGLKKAQSLFLGPGLGSQIPQIDLKKIELPAVIDADLLQPDINFPLRSILTPHRGEMLRLLSLKESPEEEALFDLCQKFAVSKNVVLILKGAPTFIFASGKEPLLIARGDPGMATAGSGDVLTGILAALLAQKMSCYDAAVLGVYLHAVAGERAAKIKSSYGMIAGDIIDCLPDGWFHLMNQSKKQGIPSSIETLGR